MERTPQIRKRLRIGPGGLVYFGGLMFLGAVAYHTQANLLFLCAGMMVGGLLASWIFSCLMMRKLEVVRLKPDAVAVGQQGEVRYRLTNHKRWMPVFGVMVREVWGKNAAAGWRSASPIAERRLLNPPASWAMHIGPGQTVFVESATWPQWRGPITLERIELSTNFPFGIFKRIVEFPQVDEWLIMPEVFQIRPRVIRPTRGREQGEGSQYDRPGGQEEFFGLREYVEGDSLQNVEWKRTARTGKLVSKEMTQPNPPELMVGLDLTAVGADDLAPPKYVDPRSRIQRLRDAIHSRSPRITPPRSNHTERAISLALSLAVESLRRGWQTGLSITGANGVKLPLDRTSSHRHVMFEATARIALPTADESTAAGDAERKAPAHVDVTVAPDAARSGNLPGGTNVLLASDWRRYVLTAKTQQEQDDGERGAQTAQGDQAAEHDATVAASAQVRMIDRLGENFRRMVLAMVAIGVVAVSMVEGNVTVLAIAAMLTTLAWFLVQRPGGRPMPQWFIAIGALAAFGSLMTDVYWRHQSMMLAMAYFTMWLQVILLFARQGNRQYSEIIVLNIMQMVCISILWVSASFVVFLAGYAVLALITLLVFQLKVTSDLVHDANRRGRPNPRATAANPSDHDGADDDDDAAAYDHADDDVPLPQPTAVAGPTRRGDLLRVAMMIGSFSMLTAAVFFVVVPRSGDRNGPGLQRRSIGFSDEINLTGGTLNAGGDDVIMKVTVVENGRIIDGLRSYHIRGAVLDRYNSYTKTWARSPANTRSDMLWRIGPDGLDLATPADDEPMIEARFVIQPGRETAIFSIQPTTYIGSSMMSSVFFNPDDQTFRRNSSRVERMVYHIRAPLRPTKETYESYVPTLKAAVDRQSDPADYLSRLNHREYETRDWRIGGEQLGDFTLSLLREMQVDYDPNRPTAAAGLRAAQALTIYLRDNYAYTLNNPRIYAGQNPIDEFLFIRRSGHCELFAASLAAMTRSIGLNSRVISGYLAIEYNRIGSYYVVRQSDAHAWVEIDAGDGNWRTFDATPASAIEQEHGVQRTWSSSLGEAYEYFEFAWLDRLVFFNGGTSAELVDRLKSINPTREGVPFHRAIFDWFRNTMAGISENPLNAAAIITPLLLATLGVILLVRRRRTMRKVERLGLGFDDASRRRLLSPQFAFYLRMLELLQSHGHHRQPWQSPMMFARSVAEDDPERFRPVLLLTQWFYDVRYGSKAITSTDRQQIDTHLGELQLSLAKVN